MASKDTLVHAYPGLVIGFQSGGCKDEVRVCNNELVYRIINRNGIPDKDLPRVDVVHSMTQGLRALRNCTAAEARMMGFDVDRKPKEDDTVILLEDTKDIRSPHGGVPNMGYGIYRVVNFQDQQVFGLKYLGRDNGLGSSDYFGMFSLKKVLVIS
jgi:hypothetical protein